MPLSVHLKPYNGNFSLEINSGAPRKTLRTFWGKSLGNFCHIDSIHYLVPYVSFANKHKDIVMQLEIFFFFNIVDVHHDERVKL